MQKYIVEIDNTRDVFQKAQSCHSTLAPQPELQPDWKVESTLSLQSDGFMLVRYRLKFSYFIFIKVYN